MLIIVNPSANGGRARARWAQIRSDVITRVGPFDECLAPDVATVRGRVHAALARHERRFVAAGGDGTVNLVIGLLADLAPPPLLAEITVGAIGLGSSNDFHKPRRPGSAIGRVPCRLDFAHPIPHDLGRTTYDGESGQRLVRHWVVNASAGTTAAGNWIYNEARGLVGLVKRRWAALAMVLAAAQALLGSRGHLVTVQREGGRSLTTRIRNLGVVKNPHFTGRLRYDSPYEPGSGDFFVHLLGDASHWETVITLLRLVRGRFAGRRRARSWRGRWLALGAATPFPVECDGEILVTRRAEFSLLPRAIRVCP